MKKIFFASLLLLLSLNASASEEVLAESMLAKGGYEVSGGFSLLINADSRYSANSSVGYFYKEKLSLDGSLGISTSNTLTTYNLGLGASYYFLVGGRIAPYASQQFLITSIESEAFYSGNTDLGTLYAITPNVGFKVFGRIGYDLDFEGDQSFALLGEFALYF